MIGDGLRLYCTTQVQQTIDHECVPRPAEARAYLSKRNCNGPNNLLCADYDLDYSTNYVRMGNLIGVKNCKEESWEALGGYIYWVMFAVDCFWGSLVFPL